MRLIDADALKERIAERIKNTMIVGWLCRIINDTPTAGPDRPCSEWLEYSTRTKSSMFICPECLGIAYFPQPTRDKSWVKKCGYKYCPNCGAKMKGGTP